MKRLLSSLFSMPKPQRNGSVVLVSIVLLLLAFRFLIPYLFKPDYSRYSNEYRELVALMEALETGSVKDTINDNEVHLNQKNEHNVYSASTLKADAGMVAGPDISKTKLIEFDPNCAGYTELVSIGFSSKVANTIIKYREKGGRFYKASDLLKIYGLDTSFYKTLYPYISIPESIDQAVVQKIEMNSADTVVWMSLKGIGPAYARRICKYRKLLGGFVSVQQLAEVYNFPEETYLACKDFLYVDSSFVEKLDLNFSDAKKLAAHPYCDYNTARKIVEYRSLSGSLKTSAILLADSVIDLDTYLKLKPYLTPE